MASSGFAINITAVDAATAKIDALNKRLHALKAPAENLTKSFKKLGELSGITNAWEKMHKGIEKSFEALKEFVPAIGALTAGGIIIGLATLVDKWADFAEQLTITASGLNMMPSQLQRTQNAMRLMGGSADDAAKVITGLDAAMQDAVSGRSPQMARLFTALGINIHKTQLVAKDASEVLPELFDKIHNFKGNAAEFERIRNMLNFTPAMMKVAREKGAAGLQEMMAEAAKHGTLSDVDSNKLATFKEHLIGLSESVENFGSRIAIGLMPKLEPLITKFEKWMMDGDNVKWTTDKIVSLVTALVDFITQLTTGIGKLVDVMGGWQNSLEIVGGLLALKILAPLIGIVAKMTELAAIRLPATILSALGIGGATAATILGAPALLAAGAYGAFKQGDKDAQAADMGFAAEKDETGLTTVSYYNPKTGERLDVDDMQHRIDSENLTRKASGLPPVGSVTPGGDKPVKQPATDATVPPEGRALLDTIAQPESGGDYHKQYGGADIADLSHHPNQAITAGGYTSTAFGKYQFLKSTWDAEAKKLGLKDMSPENQDKAAWDLANTKYKSFTGRDLATDLKDPTKNERVTRALHGLWTSLPGGSQNPTSQDTFDKRLAANENAQLKSVATTAPVKVAGNITANVNVKAPPGTTATASSDGAVAAPKVAMPMQGVM